MRIEGTNFNHIQQEFEFLINVFENGSKVVGNIYMPWMEKCIENLMEPFIFDFGNNIVELVGQLINFGGSHHLVGIRMMSVLVRFSQKEAYSGRLGSMMMYINRLPYLVCSMPDNDLLIARILSDCIFEAREGSDLSSQGKTLEMPPMNLYIGNVK